MKKELIGSTAIVGALLGATAVPAVADPDPTPPPYCAGASPGELRGGGITCNDELTGLPADETPDGDTGPGGGNPPSGGGPGGGNGPGGGGPGGGNGPGGGGPR
jgi:hypothetical protein